MQASQHGTVAVGGVDIAWERWSRAGAPTVLLVHGTSAHSGWWHHTVSSLTNRYDVVALDLAGHGDSGHRDAYSIPQWGQDVLTVLDEVVGGRAFLVGHSIGGLVAAAAAAARPDAVDGLILVDSVVQEPPVRAEPFPVASGGRVFATAQEALERYRLTPAQPVPDPQRLEYVARGSMREVDGGWSWKFDRRIFGALNRRDLTESLDHVGCPVVVIRGQHSELVPGDAGTLLASRIGRDVVQRDVPGAHHHVMIDQGPLFDKILADALAELPKSHP